MYFFSVKNITACFHFERIMTEILFFINNSYLTAVLGLVKLSNSLSLPGYSWFVHKKKGFNHSRKKYFPNYRHTEKGRLTVNTAQF